MHIQKALSLYGSNNSGETILVEKFLALLETAPYCFRRDFYRGHFTGSALIADTALTKVVMTHHKKLGKWMQLGGHADGNPDLLAVALKEVREESGLHSFTRVFSSIFDLDIHSIPETEHEPRHYHYDVRFLFLSRGDEIIANSKESYEVRWISLDVIDRYTREESIIKMLNKLIRFTKNGG